MSRELLRQLPAVDAWVSSEPWTVLCAEHSRAEVEDSYRRRPRAPAGSQAGIIAGKAKNVERLRRHPLARAVRNGAEGADVVTFSGDKLLGPRDQRNGHRDYGSRRCA